MISFVHYFGIGKSISVLLTQESQFKFGDIVSNPFLLYYVACLTQVAQLYIFQHFQLVSELL